MVDYFAESSNGNIEGLLREYPDIKSSKDKKNIADIFDPTQDAWLHSIYVKPSGRNTGEGTNLIGWFIEDCKRDGIRRIVGSLVAHHADEQEVENWYINRGFRIQEPMHGYKYVVMDLLEENVTH